MNKKWLTYLNPIVWFKYIFKLLDPRNIPLVCDIWNIFDESLKDHLGKYSSTRIAAYVILALIILWTIHMMNTTVTVQDTGILGTLIINMCALLGIKSRSEKTSFPSYEEKMRVEQTSQLSHGYNEPTYQDYDDDKEDEININIYKNDPIGSYEDYMNKQNDKEE